jgi:hypothetical protein
MTIAPQAVSVFKKKNEKIFLAKNTKKNKNASTKL